MTCWARLARKAATDDGVTGLQTLQNGLGQIRLVLGVCLPVGQLNVNPARRDGVSFVGKPYLVEIVAASEGAESVEPLPILRIEVNPWARGFRVVATGRQLRRGGEKLVGKVRPVVNGEPVARKLFAVGRKNLLPDEHEHRLRQRTLRRGRAVRRQPRQNKTRQQRRGLFCDTQSHGYLLSSKGEANGLSNSSANSGTPNNAMQPTAHSAAFIRETWL